MSRQIILNWPAPSKTAVGPAQTVVAGGYFALNTSLECPSVVLFPKLARTITLTSGSDLSALQLVLTGFDAYKNPITETINGPKNNTVNSGNQYHQLASVQILGDMGNATMSLGTGSESTFPWTPMDIYRQHAQISIQAVVTGTVTYSVYQTLDDPEYNKGGVEVVTSPNAFEIDASLVDATDNQLYYLQNPVAALNLQVDEDSTGSITLTILQQGNR